MIIAISILLALNNIALIIFVLMQQGKSMGLGSIAGGAETFFGKQKAKSYEARLSLLTKISAGTFMALSLLLVILQKLA